MPDSWEIDNGFDPVVADNNVVMVSGYTALETYINGITAAEAAVIYSDGFEAN